MIPQRFASIRPTILTVAGVLSLGVAALSLGGCQYIGAILDKVTDEQVPAEYTPTREDMLILVEDSHNHDLIGTLGDRVMANVADDLTRHKIDQVIDPGKVLQFATDDHDAFRKMSIVNLAHKFKARQVLYADVTSFNVTAPIGSDTAKGILIARVKIIDAQTGETRWPQDSGWRSLTIETPTLPLKPGGSLEPLNDYIVDRLSQTISELFYVHPAVRGDSPEHTNEF